MAVVRRRPGIGRVTRYCVPVASASGPTVLLNANYLTDTLINLSNVPVSNGEYVKSWATATGGTFTSALAIAAGATDAPVYVAASGVETLGANAALTVATPITIPADTDCDIWVYTYWSEAGYNYLLGRVSGSEFVALDDSLGGQVANSEGGLSYYDGAYPAVGWRLLRAGRSAAGAWTFAWTGRSEVSATDSGAGAGQIRLDTILAMDGTGSGFLGNFASSGNFLKAARIVTYPSGYAGRAAYRSAYETAISGAPLT